MWKLSLLLGALCYIFLITSTTGEDVQKDIEETTELATAQRNPVAFAKISEKQKEQILNGLRGAASLMKFLHEKNFFKLLTTVSGVIGPIFTVATVIAQIVFFFMDVESAEMQQMKIEFTKLNNRLDQWNEEFSEIKRMIDWNAIQVSFGGIERSIQTMSTHVSSFVNSPEAYRDQEKSLFITRYESTFLDTAEKLYTSMVNTEMIFSENLFRASQVYTEYHRGKVQNFMMGNLQLLLKAVEIQATYIQLKYNSEQATEFTKDLWEKKMQHLRDRMAAVDEDTKNRWHTQVERDLDSLLAKHYKLSNQDFEGVLHQFISSKYDWRAWLTVTYNELSGWDNHAALHCSSTGAVRFRSHGRNVHIASVEPSPNEGFEEKLQAANRLLDTYERQGVPKHGRSDHARLVMETLSNANPHSCGYFKYIGAIAWGSNVWYYTNPRLAYRKLCVQNGKCFNVYILV